jgi:fumarylpyruvate hydrolase
MPSGGAKTCLRINAKSCLRQSILGFAMYNGEMSREAADKYRRTTERSRVNELLFPAPPVVAAPVRGRSERIPVRRIFCVGRNYEAHAREMGVAVDREAPFYFTKAAEHYVASGSTVPYPPGTSNYHHELELVVVLGAPAFQIAADRALECVFGYACGLDMTRRDLQSAAKEQRRPWDLAKDVEQSAVLSEIAPASEIGHPSAGRIELRVNGEIKQSADISQLIHKVPEVIAHLSAFYHLQPGDLIYTGTPEGVGPVKIGDVLEGVIDGVGTIALRIAAPA